MLLIVLEHLFGKKSFKSDIALFAECHFRQKQTITRHKNNVQPYFVNHDSFGYKPNSHNLPNNFHIAVEEAE